MTEKINAMHIKNIARVSEVVFDPPKKGLITIGGQNAAGKTSLLKSIYAGLGGKVPELKEGKNRGSIELELDNYIVSLYISQKGNKIKVEAKDKPGVSISSPKTFLKDIFGKRCFDVPEFLYATEKNQVEALLKILDIPGKKEDLEQIGQGKINLEGVDDKVHIFVNEAYNQIKAQKSILTQKKRSLSKEIEDKRESYDLDITEINIEELYKLKEKATKKEQIKKDISGCNEKKSVAEENINEYENQIRHYQKLIEAKKEEILRFDESIKSFADELEELSPYEVLEIEEEINRAKKNNEEFHLVKEVKRQTDELTGITQEIAGLKEIQQDINEYKIDIMNRTKFPIEELDIKAGQIYYKGHPLKVASGAQQMLVATSIAATEIPKEGLQALFILDPPQLDDSSWTFLEEFAEKKNIQIWIAKVTNNKENSHIYLVEGVQQ